VVSNGESLSLRKGHNRMFDLTFDRRSVTGHSRSDQIAALRPVHFTDRITTILGALRRWWGSRRPKSFRRTPNTKPSALLALPVLWDGSGLTSMRLSSKIRKFGVCRTKSR